MKQNKEKSKTTYADGSTYEGETKGFVRHGYGTYSWNEGGIYEGNWVNGEMEGEGTMTYPSGAKYVGFFKKGYENGEGTLTYTDGYEFVGKFKDGRPVGAEKDKDYHDPRYNSAPDPKAEEWAEKNQWFGKDEIMTLASFAIHRKLMDEGFDPSSDEYYKEIDNRMKFEFSNRFSNGKYIGEGSSLN